MRFLRHPWMLVSALWIVPAIFGAVNEIAQRTMSGEPALDVGAILFGIFDWLLYALLTPGVFWTARRWPLARPHLGKHLALHLGISLLFCVAWAGAGTLLKMMWTPQTLWGPPLESFLRWLFITFPFGVSVYLGVVGTEHAIRYFVEARDRELQMARLAEQLSNARLAALQASVHPHFLFNTLNTVIVLVRDGERAAATRIIEQLSEVLRQSLRRAQTNEVSLGRELDLVSQYLAIEQARFSDRLRAQFEIDETLLSAAVPAFALQHLVDNAIRHGIAKAADAGTVLVRARRDGDVLELSVHDDGIGTAPDPHPVGHGLENTRERLQALYGRDASLTVVPMQPRGTIATLRVPYREMPPEPDRDDER